MQFCAHFLHFRLIWVKCYVADVGNVKAILHVGTWISVQQMCVWWRWTFTGCMLERNGRCATSTSAGNTWTTKENQTSQTSLYERAFTVCHDVQINNNNNNNCIRLWRDGQQWIDRQLILEVRPFQWHQSAFRNESGDSEKKFFPTLSSGTALPLRQDEIDDWHHRLILFRSDSKYAAWISAGHVRTALTLKRLLYPSRPDLQNSITFWNVLRLLLFICLVRAACVWYRP